MVERYPLIVETGLTLEDVNKSLTEVKELIKILRNAVKND